MSSLTILQAERTSNTNTLKSYKNLMLQTPVGSEEHALAAKQISILENKIIEIDNKIEELKKVKKQINETEKQIVKEEESDVNKWHSFKKALSVYEETQMCFHRSSQPRYFYKKTYQDLDVKTRLPLPTTTVLEFFPPSTLKDCWVQLENESAQKFFKHMVHGETISVKDPDTGTLETFEFDRRVYSKLGNTRNVPDKDSYNLIDFSKIMKPNGVEDECPAIIKQLLLAITGNYEIVDADGNIKLTKPENMEWFERWLYGVLVADVGNNMLSMPIIYGSGKVGKNALFDRIFPRVFGTELCFTGMWDSMDANFTGFKLGKVFIYIDEIPAKDDWTKLKNLTGSVTELVKQKYGPEFVVENTVAMAMGSNQHIYPLPLEDGKQMSRVSPIATDPRSTFAENTYRYFEKEKPGLLIEILKNQNIDVEAIKDDPYELGDKFLRNNNDLWCSEEHVQSFLNYLHGKFKDEKYTLAPLRGQDWEEILRTKPNPVNEVVDYIKERNVDLITISELYEVYQVIAGDKKNSQFIKHPKNFAAQIWPLLKDIGYERKQQCRIEIEPSAASHMKQILVNGEAKRIIGQTTVFHKPGVKPEMHKQSIDPYIVEERVGQTTIRRLVYSVSDKDTNN